MTPNLIPNDYRIANRPGNPKWKGMGAWLNEASGIKPTTAQRAADEIGDVWDLPTGPRDVIAGILKEIYGPLEQENQILREELAEARMLEGQS